MTVQGHHVPVWYDEGTGPTDGEVPVWNATAGRWEIGAGGAVASVDGQTGAVDLSGTYVEVPDDPTTVVANYAMVTTDSLILANALGGPLIITLPAAPTLGGVYSVMKSDISAHVVMVRPGSGVMNGSALLTAPHQLGLYVFDGTNWNNAIPAALPFSPAQLPGLVGWWDAAQIGGLADASALATWPDLSGAGNDMLQATAGSRPAYHTAGGNIINGLPAVRFDGVDNVMLTAAPLDTGTDDFAMFVVYKRVSGETLNIMFAHGTGETNGVAIALVSSSVGYLTGGVSWNASSTPLDLNAHQVSLIRSGTTVMRQDGATTSAPDTVPVAPSGSASLGSHIGSAFFNGVIAEAIFLNQAPSSADRLRLESYLRAKWGTP